MWKYETLAQQLADLDYVERQEVIRRAEELAESWYSEGNGPRVETNLVTGEARWVS